MQSPWIPDDLDKDWSFTCNTKGWTCNDIGEQWIQQCFDPATSEKANGLTRLIVCDGHDSHVTPKFIRFCMDNNIQVALMPPHSSHICQPLDIACFGPVKKAMSDEIDPIIRHGVARIMKFEWTGSYQRARKSALSVSNIKAGFRSAGLVPFNRHKVLSKFPQQSSSTGTNDTPLSPQTVDPFVNIPETPSRLDSERLRIANRALNTNLSSGTLNTPTKKYITKLTSLSEQLRAHNIIAERNYTEALKIIHERKERTSGKRHALKGHVLVTTKEVLEKLENADKATQEWKKRKVNKKAKKVSEPSTSESANAPISLDQIVFYSVENTEHIMSK